MTAHIPRFWTPQTLVVGKALTLGGDIAHHLLRVLRKSSGDSIRLFNAADGEWGATLRNAHKRDVTVVLEERLRPPETPTLPLVLCAPLLKPSPMEWLVEKATELGVTHFAPCQMQYSQGRTWNLERLSTIALGAVQQSGRLSVPVFQALAPLESHLESWAREGETHWAYGVLGAPDVVKPEALGQRLGFIVGPEGGLGSRDLEILERHEATPIRLSSHILRSETAALAGIARLVYERL